MKFLSLTRGLIITKTKLFHAICYQISAIALEYVFATLNSLIFLYVASLIESCWCVSQSHLTSSPITHVVVVIDKAKFMKSQFKSRINLIVDECFWMGVASTYDQVKYRIGCGVAKRDAWGHCSPSSSSIVHSGGGCDMLMIPLIAIGVCVFFTYIYV